MDSESNIEISSNNLKIKIATSSSKKQGEESLDSISNLPSPTIKSSIESSPYESPLVSPPSSAFVSALQSPYISPRATLPNPTNSTITTCTSTTTNPSTPEDLPSSSYTPPSDPYEFSDDTSDTMLKFMTCVPETVPPRISFSFPVPRVSFAKGPVSPATTNSKLGSCDVYIGFHGQNPNLIRFCKWLKSELELQGIDCLLADRSKYSDIQSHEIADRVICSVAFGLVIITSSSFLNRLSMEEVRFFAQKKNLIPIFFDALPAEIMSLLNCNSIDKECKEAIDGLVKCNEFCLEANDGNLRSCISKVSSILRARLGRKNVGHKDNHNMQGFENLLPFPRNAYFVGREKEIMEIEALLFGNRNLMEQQVQDHYRASGSGQSEGLADEESESTVGKGGGGRYISLEIGRNKEPNLEAWIEQPMVGNNSLKRLKNKKTKSGSYNKSLCSSSSVICINGVSGIGKSELALEFAHRYYQRYKMVLWIGGEARNLRQNILNLSRNFGLDVGADTETERGRIRSFEEQEIEAFKRIKRELFGETPYLLIIDNLETEEEWWEGKDLYDLMPKNNIGGTHVVITTRLSKVKNYDTIHLPPLPLSDAMTLIRGRKRIEYSIDEVNFIEKFYDKLGRLSFGLSMIGSLLSELSISPSALFESIDQVSLNDDSNSCCLSIAQEQWCKNNHFLMKTLLFCLETLEKTKAKGNLLAIRMLLVGGWFSPAPISANLLVNAAKSVSASENHLKKWTSCMSLTSSCLSPQTWKDEEDSASLLVKFGLAKRTNLHDDGCWLRFHSITQTFAKRKGGLKYAKAAIQGVRKMSNHVVSDHLWESAFLVFGFKSEPPVVELKATDMVLYIKRTALPLAIQAFTTFSRCNSSLELLKVCTNALEEVEKSFVTQIQDWSHDSICWKKRLQRRQKVDEYVWQDVTLLKATLLETRAKLLARGGHLDSGKELCRTCISIRTVMLGHNHAQTLAAQETLARLVRMRSKI
ncbi:uncharacterized protein LOC123918335 [Trifolium pratense]|uniref:uncharacterized protein LOC123918335 n=1 Tax=Trifolium pratense TaxID=57577 RepID=UPI001E692870|nr:uncharacterized protein LOC123918335 [Trifolium pratense]